MLASLPARAAAAVELDAVGNTMRSMKHSFQVGGCHYLSWAGPVWLQAQRCRQELSFGSRRVGRIDRRRPACQAPRDRFKISGWTRASSTIGERAVMTLYSFGPSKTGHST